MNRLLIIVIAALLSVPTAGAASSQTFTVGFILGSVSARLASDASWEPLFIGDEISIGDSVATEPESRLELVNAGMQRVTLGEKFKNILSVAAVPALSGLQSGSSALSKLMNTRSGMTVTSPVAVAAIRGKTAAETEQTDTETELAAEEQAQILLDEALRLRSEIDDMIETNNTEAAMAAMDQSRQLAEQALQLLETAGVTD